MNTTTQPLYNPKEEHDACGVGFVGNISNKAEYKIIEHAIDAMSRLTHRGGQEEDKKMADGSGILTPLPYDFFASHFPVLPTLKECWGLGFFFLPYDSFMHNILFDCIKKVAAQFQFRLEACREVPTDINTVSRKVLATLPEFKQILFVAESPAVNAKNIEQHLYVLRKQIEFETIEVLTKHNIDLSVFHIASLSSKSVVYKGILPGKNLAKFYLDLADPNFKVPFVVFHERFSTNTKPSWHMTQPFRHIAHNGEINTIRGNKTQMQVREKALQSDILGENLPHVLPCIHPSTSDSGAFDNVFELLLQGGYDLSHAITTMIPEPILDSAEQGKKDFYTYHAPLMEAWDGPTTMVFTDGHSKVGASLDRNGLRPCRYSITEEDVIVVSSEVGVIEQESTKYKEQGQLSPRSLLIVDFENNVILHDEEIKEKLFKKANYSQINQERTQKLDREGKEGEEEKRTQSSYFKCFGFGEKSPEAMISAMVDGTEEPVGAMGIDEPLAVLSSKPQSLFNYFKQLFAQVTNPSIDPTREKFSMSLFTTLAGKGNLFQKPEAQNAHYLLDTPFLFAKDMDQIRANQKLKTSTININMPLHDGLTVFKAKLTSICKEAEQSAKDGVKIIILSDKSTTKDSMPLPILLVVAAVSQHLTDKGLRHISDIVVESGQAFEVMHMALLFSFGASAIYPYGAYTAVKEYLASKKIRGGYSFEDALTRYSKALEKGLLKVFARLGVSTLSSFIGSRSFECVGLHHSVIDRYFSNTLSRIGGITLEDIYQENYERCLSYVAETHETSKSDRHIWSKESCSTLRKSVVEKNYHFFQLYTKLLSKQQECITLRSVLKFKKRKAIREEDVESIESIQKRFFSAPMSLGALSQESHECIALGFNTLGLSSNCGEGGEEIARSQSRGTEKDLCSRIRQIASGRFGVTAEYLAAGDEVQIKIAQGAKPGEGGQLPAHKVTSYIAKVRHTQENVSLISPPPHHDIYSIEDLSQLIFDIKKLKKGLKVSVKLVAQAGIGTVAVGVVKAGADSICISGHDGGTGAAPLSSIYHVGLPWELGLAEVHQALIANAMRHKVRLQTDGQIQSGRDIIAAFMFGADDIAFGTSLLVSMGCILCKQCYKGHCPVGICTQDDNLRAKFNGKAEHIINYLQFLATETRQYLALLGFSSVNEIIGRADLFQMDTRLLPKKAKNLDMVHLFENKPYTQSEFFRAVELSEWEEEFYKQVEESIKNSTRFTSTQKVKNTDRAIGVNVAGLMALSYQDFEDNSFILECEGSCGQSFAAFAPKGLSLNLTGCANDYVAKGLCGAIVSIRPNQDYPSSFENQAIAGNVCLYGATSGKVFISGRAGERFAVRNSGALAVVEGVGEHALEYMTGGQVVILGSCGYNCAAGMTGGIAYVYDKEANLHEKINPTNVKLAELSADDFLALQAILEEHVQQTKSLKAKNILENYEIEKMSFKKIFSPTEGV